MRQTGLYYYGARYYNPKLSIWYGVDPLAEKIPAWLPYAYVFDNPINFIDPTGMEPDDIIIRGKNGNTITIPTAGDDIEFDINYDIKKSDTWDTGLDYIDSSSFAIGLNREISVEISAVVLAAGAVGYSEVSFQNEEYGGYNYHYPYWSAELSGGANVNIGDAVGSQFFIAYNTAKNPDYNPELFAGDASFAKVSQDAKVPISLGWDVSGFSSGQWKGLSFGFSMGGGVGANAGSISYGESSSILLNDVKPTSKRTKTDIMMNHFPNSTVRVIHSVQQYLRK